MGALQQALQRSKRVRSSNWSLNPSRLLLPLKLTPRHLLEDTPRKTVLLEIQPRTGAFRSTMSTRRKKNCECDAPQRTCWQNHHWNFLHERSTSPCQALDPLQ